MNTAAVIIAALLGMSLTVSAAPTQRSAHALSTAARITGDTSCFTSSLVGFYDNLKYSGSKKNNWHYVTITKVDDSTLRWSNRAGVKWTLKVKSAGSKVDRKALLVQADSPYYKSGHKEATIVWDDKGEVKALLGPWGEAYTKLPNSALEITEALVGKYDNLGYTGAAKNNWHYVTLTAAGTKQLQWENRAGVKWTLELEPKDNGYNRDRFLVKPNSPYYTRGHTQGSIVWNADQTKVVAITGPWNERYTRV